MAAGDPIPPAEGEVRSQLSGVLARMGVTESGYRALVEQLPLVVYLEAIEGLSRALYMAPGIEPMLGYSPDEWVANEDTWFDHVHPDDRGRVVAASRLCDETGEPFRQEYRLRHRDGHHVWVLEQSQLVEDADGVALCWQGYLLDITARKVSERRRRDAEARLRTLIETIPAITYTHHHRSDSFEYVSPQVGAILGYTPEEWSGELWRSILHPDDRAAMLAENDRVDRSGEPFSMEYRVFAADGRTVWLRDESVLLRDPEGRPTQWQGVMYDITEAKDAEERLRLAEARYRSVVENSPAALYVEDLNPEWFGTLYASPQVEAITGYPASEWIDDPDLWLKVVHPDDLPAVLAAERRSIETGEPFSMDVRMVRPDGSVVWVHDSSVLVRNEMGAPQFWQGFFHDITEKKQAEQELARALELERRSVERLRTLDEMKDVFLTAVSHELRSPLAAILGSAKTLEQLDGQLDAADRTGLVGGIITKAERLRELVEDLLDLERVRQGAAEIGREEVDLADLARAAIEASGLSATHRLRPDLPSVVLSVDPTMIGRIFDNLLSNAARYTPAGSTVWIRVRQLADGAEVIVEDDGHGVPSEHREVLFDPFRQGPETVSHAPGVGVGLALVARFADLHGGRAWVDERPGGGASFHVMLEGPRPPR